MRYIDELFSLEAERIVVTGGAGVLPSAMAEALLRAGAKVSVWGRGSSHPVGEAVAKLADATGAGDRVSGVTVDTGDADSVAKALEETISAVGMPTVLINGVGGNKGKSAFLDLDDALFEEILRLNLMAGLVIPTKAFAKAWIGAGVPGSIINLASMASYIPLSGVWAYGAAKSAVLNLTYATAKEFAKHKIRVNAIAPGFFVGYQNKSLLIANEQTGELTERGQSIIDHTPVGRFGEIGDIVGTTVFLASRAASGFLNGVCIPVDGGYLVDNI